MSIRLRYHDVHGVSVETKAVELDEAEPPLRPPLEAVRLQLDLPDRTAHVRCVRPVDRGPGGLTAGCRQLDGEILAGLRLARLCDGRPYPRSVSRLLGYDADAAQPFALLEPLRGVEVGTLAGTLPTEQRRRFQIGLLRAVRLLNAAGIAHRGISPGTVRWDGDDVQITDFAHAAPIGAPRTVVGVMPWQAPEQRSKPPRDWEPGLIGPNDDVWAAGRLIFYVLTGEELDDTAKLADRPELAELLAGVILPPERRPDAQTLLRRLGEADAPPRPLAADPAFSRGRAEFFAQRRRKHPHTAPDPVTETKAPPVHETGDQDSGAHDSGDGASEPRSLDGSWLLWGGVTVLVVLALYLIVGR
ncbi:hypothetical protein [Actinomadura chokoriensis]|uniref:Protein kinase domain-containing protein n=1 Tax=Actinomadura chokoriensis TaxID=454156 RepID=A0ABV4QY81_9ACTN